jgi:hypothetical protein
VWLRTLFQASAETEAEISAAAEERWAAAQSLLATGRFGDAVYLYGYVAEMLLKRANYLYLVRTSRAALADTVPSVFSPARSRGQTLIPGISPEGFHSLRFWAMLLEADREQLGDALPMPLAGSFQSVTERLHNHWFVEMRYRALQSPRSEALEVQQDVGWLRAHKDDIWR